MLACRLVIAQFRIFVREEKYAQAILLKYSHDRTFDWEIRRFPRIAGRLYRVIFCGEKIFLTLCASARGEQVRDV